MGSLEARASKNRKRARVRDAVILSLYGATAISLAVAVPNAVRLLAYLDPLIHEKRDPGSRIREAYKRLEKQGIVIRSQKGLHGEYKLSERGRSRAALLSLIAKAQKRKRWDTKWRIIVFDVWERRRRIRDRLRELLEETGFYRLQHSVWVYPYACEELIGYLRTELKLGGGPVYLIAEGIEGEATLKKHFRLP